MNRIAGLQIGCLSTNVERTKEWLGPAFVYSVPSLLSPLRHSQDITHIFPLFADSTRPNLYFRTAFTYERAVTVHDEHGSAKAGFDGTSF
jgi:hypothetical protein